MTNSPDTAVGAVPQTQEIQLPSIPDFSRVRTERGKTLLESANLFSGTNIKQTRFERRNKSGQTETIMRFDLIDTFRSSNPSEISYNDKLKRGEKFYFVFDHNGILRNVNFTPIPFKPRAYSIVFDLDSPSFAVGRISSDGKESEFTKLEKEGFPEFALDKLNIFYSLLEERMQYIPISIGTEDLVTRAEVDFRGLIVNGELSIVQIQDFIREHVMGIRLKGTEVIFVDCEFSDESINPVLKAFLKSTKN